jgi:hypothetical protein
MFDEKMMTVRQFDKFFYWFFNIILVIFLLFKLWSIYLFRTEENKFYKTFLDNFKFNSSNNSIRGDSNISEEKFI